MKNNKKAGCIMSLVMLLAGNSLAAGNDERSSEFDPTWNNATVYFMMTDRFANGDKSNDQQYQRKQDGAPLRNFMGGDIAGITQKIKDGYFSALGVDVLWMTPLNEQIHGHWDEDWGRSYPFHGYWPKDWTALDPNFGSEAQMKTMIETAHAHGIRVLADVIVNHTGPQTDIDPAWPNDWVRTKPICQWNSYAANVKCALASSLTDTRTESEEPVELPPFLLKKWQQEGRQAQELAELDQFFERTQLPRAPKYYIIKWLTDWVRDYGIDGFRVDTAKHVEGDVWVVLKEQAQIAFADFKAKNSTPKISDTPFYMVGEVMHFGVDGFNNTPQGTRLYDYGDKQVDFYNYGFDSLINMGFAHHAHGSLEQIFSTYSRELNEGALKGVGVLNYVVSHDDPQPFDKERATPYQTAVKLLLAPGGAQIYYGDELARDLTIEGTIGDATWRSFMNWQDLKQPKTQALLKHWQKLGTFRRAHLAVGAGVHKKLNDKPYVFSRHYNRGAISDQVLVALDVAKGSKTIQIHQVFSDGQIIKDYYSDTLLTVKNGAVTLNTPFSIVLLGQH